MEVISSFLLARLAVGNESRWLQKCAEDIVEGQLLKFHVGLYWESRRDAIER